MFLSNFLKGGRNLPLRKMSKLFFRLFLPLAFPRIYCSLLRIFLKGKVYFPFLFLFFFFVFEKIHFDVAIGMSQVLGTLVFWIMLLVQKDPSIPGFSNW